MKILYIIFMILFLSMDFFSQIDTTKSSTDSLTYADTVWSEIAPVVLNIADVRKMVVYPEEAIEDMIEGRIEIKVLVGHNGEVEKTGEIKGPSVFYAEIRRVSMFLRFTPGKVNLHPVKVWVTVPFTFKLYNK